MSPGDGQTPPGRPNQFALLRQRRFAPFFWTQFLGAANDNLFKFAFTVLATYQLQLDWLPPSLAGLVIGALFILPFVLFSATAGQIADRRDKARVMRFVKSLELAIMAVAAYGLLAGDAVAMLGCIFALGVHSTLFGPCKHAYLPQHLDAREITGGNGMVGMGTFVAILLGNVAGGLLIALPEAGRASVAVGGLTLALLGRLAAQGIPASPPSAPPDGAPLRVNPFAETWRNLRLAAADPVLLRTQLGISWMWFYGAVFLAQFPSFAKEVLHGDERVASLLLVVFSVGVAIGSLLCERFSRRGPELGLVAAGALGMTMFGVDLYFASRALPAADALLGLAPFLAQPAHWRVLADLLLLSCAAGVYSIPMYALIQLRAVPSHRARIVAANNILNALFMVVSALFAGALLALGASVPQVFLATALLNLPLAGQLFWGVAPYRERLRGLWRGLLVR